MKKIAIFQTNLKIGGIQKSCLNLLRNLDEQRVSVDFYLLDSTNQFNTQIPKWVNVIEMNLNVSKFAKLLPFVLAKKMYHNSIKRKIKNQKYDLAIDFDSYNIFTAISAILVDSTKKIIWIHNDVKIKQSEEFKYRLIFNLNKSKYKYFSDFVGVSKGVIDPFRESCKIAGNFHVIPNIIDDNEIIEKSKIENYFEIDPNYINLVTVGRLCHQKGIDLLLNEFATALLINPLLRLFIIGNGPDRKKLIKQSEKLNIQNSVFFLGNQSNPFNYMNKCDAFILNSRYEGQGMVLLEAKVLGLKLIFPRHLEKYNENLFGVDDVMEEVIKLKREPKKNCSLTLYNTEILNKIYNL